MPIQTEDIIKREFSRAFVGYDVQEVDVFLDAVIDRLEKLESQRRDMILAMEYLLKRLEHAGELTPGVKKALGSSDRALRRLIEAAVTPAPEPEPVQRPRKRRDADMQERKRNRGRSTEEPPQSVERDAKPDERNEEPPQTSRIAEPAVAQQKATPTVGRSPFRVGYAKPADAGVAASAHTEPNTAAGAPEEEGAETLTAREPDVAATPHDGAPVEDATDLDKLIPELMRDLESALTEGVIRSASDIEQDAPVRAHEDGAL